MEHSRRLRRAAAGRSGGIFEKSTDIDGTPIYHYQLTNLPHSTRGQYGRGATAFSLDETHGERVDKGREEDCYLENDSTQSVMSLIGDENSDSCSCICTVKDQDRSMGPSMGESAKAHSLACKTPKWFRSMAVLKGKVSKFRTRTVERLFELKLASSWRKELSPDHSVGVYRDTTDARDTSIADMSHNLSEHTASRNPAQPSHFTMPDEPQFEDGYFSSDQDSSDASVDFAFFCSFPSSDPEKSGSGSGSGDGNRATNEHDESDKLLPARAIQHHLSRDMRNHYEVLGLDHKCETGEITVRARQLMSCLHPDKRSTRSEQQKIIDAREFARVSLAKTELLDTELRITHDEEIADGSWDGVPWT